jgi:hypothetical protein
MLIDYFIDILSIKIRIPDLLRINDDDGASFAAIQASRRIDANLSRSSQAQLLDSIFGIIADCCCVALFAALFALLPLVSAEKYMVLIVRHTPLL